MSVKVDVERSTKARTEGNASFKKGRWTEAIGHYTTAIVFNPGEGLGYTNRAAAYLKIDKWKDAERDCSTAISLAKGDGNVKALYRRSLARKALGDIEGAIEDIQSVLRVEPTNATGLEELEELEELRRKAENDAEERRKKAKALPPSPPRSPAPATASPAVESIAPEAHPEAPASKTEEVVSPAVGPIKDAPRGSFADLKRDRQTGRKTYATPSMIPSPPAPTANLQLSSESEATTRPTSPSSLPLETVSIADSTISPSRPKISLPLLDPDVPGSALSLISAIRSHPAMDTYPIIADLAKRPAGIGRMLDNFLEPDQLALILSRLRETLGLEEVEKGERAEVVTGFVTGMRKTRRWAMTAIMLSGKERQLGQDIWDSAGGAGDWTRGT